MLNLLPINNIGRVGINTDLPQWELEPEYLTDGLNFRVTEGHIEPSGGSKELTSFILNDIMGNSFFVPSVSGIESDIFIGGTSIGLFAYDSIVKKQILNLTTPVADIYGWTYCRMGAYVICNHPEAGCFYWLSKMGVSDPLALPLPFDNHGAVWNPALKKTGEIVRSFKNFLFMLNLTETDVNNNVNIMPDTFRWSHPANVNTIPVTWDETDQFFMAGIASLGTDSGYIVDGLALRDSFVIYSSNSINMLDLSGDDLVWRRSSLTTTAGLLTKNCVVECRGNHFMLVNGDIVVNNGNSIDSIAHNRIKRHLNVNISTEAYARSYVLRNDIQKEIWFCIPQEGSATANLAYVFNWKDESWAIRDLPADNAYAVYGSVNNQGNLSWSDYNKKVPSAIWKSTNDSWGSSSLSPFNNTVVGHTLGATLYDIDDSTNASVVNTFVERLNYPLDGHRQVNTVIRAYPHIIGSPVRIRFGAHDYAGAPVRWYKDWITFNPSKDRKIDFRVTGELIAWRIESIDNGRFEFSGLDIEHSRVGQR